MVLNDNLLSPMHHNQQNILNDMSEIDSRHVIFSEIPPTEDKQDESSNFFIKKTTNTPRYYNQGREDDQSDSVDNYKMPLRGHNGRNGKIKVASEHGKYNNSFWTKLNQRPP